MENDVVISVTSYGVTENDKGIVGYARLVFEGKYAVNNIEIRENASGELYTKMPHYQSRNSSGRLEDRDVFYAKDKEVSNMISGAIIEEYSYTKQHISTGSYKMLEDKKFEISDVVVRPFSSEKNDKTRGACDIDFGDFKVRNGYMSELPNGQGKLVTNFQAQKRVLFDSETNDGVEKWVNNFTPINHEASEELRNAVTKAYNAHISRDASQTEVKTEGVARPQSKFGRR